MKIYRLIMKINQETIEFKTKEQMAISDLTSKIEKIVRKSRIRNGLLNIQSLHTTATVFINERETELLKDFCHHLEKISPQKDKYFHDDFEVRTENFCGDECANGHSHCKALNLPTSITLNIVNNKIELGRWQRILFIELDRSRERKISIALFGE